MNKEKVFTDCQKIYEANGFSAVINHITAQQEKSNPDYDNVRYAHCTACNCSVPSLDDTCLVCGQSTRREVKPRYKIWVEIVRIDNPGTDDEEYSDTEFPEAIAYRETFEDATELQQQIVKNFGEL